MSDYILRPRPVVSTIHIINPITGGDEVYTPTQKILLRPGHQIRLTGTSFCAGWTGPGDPFEGGDPSEPYVTEPHLWIGPNFITPVSFSVTEALFDVPGIGVEGTMLLQANRSSTVGGVVHEYKLNSNRLHCQYIFSWTDTVLIPKKTIIKAVHVEELRGALNSKLDGSNNPRPTYNRPSPLLGSAIGCSEYTELMDTIDLYRDPTEWASYVAPGEPVKASLVQEIRNAINRLQFDTPQIPSITAWDPRNGSGLEKITVRGTLLDLVTHCTIGAMEVDEIVHVDSTWLEITIPDMALTGDIVLQGQDIDDINLGEFVINAPVIDHIDPESLFVAAGTTYHVHIFGALGSFDENPGQTVQVIYNNLPLASFARIAVDDWMIGIDEFNVAPGASIKVKIGAYESNEVPLQIVEYQVNRNIIYCNAIPYNHYVTGCAVRGNRLLAIVESYLNTRMNCFVYEIDLITGSLLNIWDAAGMPLAVNPFANNIAPGAAPYKAGYEYFDRQLDWFDDNHFTLTSWRQGYNDPLNYTLINADIKVNSVTVDMGIQTATDINVTIADPEDWEGRYDAPEGFMHVENVTLLDPTTGFNALRIVGYTHDANNAIKGVMKARNEAGTITDITRGIFAPSWPVRPAISGDRQGLTEVKAFEMPTNYTGGRIKVDSYSGDLVYTDIYDRDDGVGGTVPTARYFTCDPLNKTIIRDQGQTEFQRCSKLGDDVFPGANPISLRTFVANPPSNVGYYEYQAWPNAYDAERVIAITPLDNGAADGTAIDPITYEPASGLSGVLHNFGRLDSELYVKMNENNLSGGRGIWCMDRTTGNLYILNAIVIPEGLRLKIERLEILFS